MTLATIPILDVWGVLGGGLIFGRRARAFWRDGDGLNVSLDPEKNCWFDHRDQVGGGVLQLVETALDCDRHRALGFLEHHAGLDPRTPTSPGVAKQAPLLAARLANFHRGLEMVADRQVSPNDALLDLGLGPEVLARGHRQRAILKAASPAVIADVWRTMPDRREQVERIGREDRENTESITRAIVDLLAASQESTR